MAKHPMAYQHQHAYVYQFRIQSRCGGKVDEQYILLTDIDGPNCRQNRLLLETAMRVSYGFFPNNIKFKYEKSIV